MLACPHCDSKQLEMVLEIMGDIHYPLDETGAAIKERKSFTGEIFSYIKCLGCLKQFELETSQNIDSITL